MGWLMLAFLVVVAIFTLVAYVVGTWISDYVQRHIQGRLDAIDQLVNDEQVPTDWLRPYRRRADRLRKAGANERRIRRLEQAARKQCLIRIGELQRYVVGSGVADSGDTRHVIVTSLQDQAQRWQDDTTWHELVDFTQPERVVARSHDSTGEDEADWNGRDHNRD
jgi:hypothetical protein